jgi:hypothetical protein
MIQILGGIKCHSRTEPDDEERITRRDSLGDGGDFLNDGAMTGDGRLRLMNRSF